MIRPLLIAAVALGVSCGDGAATQRRVHLVDTTFAGLVAGLSEPGGYFNTDNLISNERSYLHVMNRLESQGIRGGAYLGVGPDQNFSYIAEIEPEIAFIIDIRRDNLLEHLLFKAVFAETSDRAEYLALLLGLPASTERVEGAARDIVTELRNRHGSPASIRRALDAVARRVTTFGIPLSDGDLETIARFHRAFIANGFDLRFNSFGRAPQSYYPTYGDLLVETGREGAPRSFVASAERFDVVRALQLADRVVPVVGNLAGRHAVRAVGEYLRERAIAVTAFYTSNVEFYLFGDRGFGSFVANLASLPGAPNAVVIRSIFIRGAGGMHPDAVPGYASVQSLQPFDSVTEDPEGIRGYWDLVTRGRVAVGR